MTEQERNFDLVSEVSHEELETENKSLKQRIAELEQRINELEAELELHRGFSIRHFNVREKLDELLVLVATVLLASVPPLLVVQDLWLGHRGAKDFFRDWWCSSEFLCQTAFPPYFLLIFFCFISLLLLFEFHQTEATIVKPSSDNRQNDKAVSGVRSTSFQTSHILIIGSVILAMLSFFRVFGGDNELPGWGYAGAILMFVFGWIIRETSIRDLVERWHRNTTWILSLLLTHLALIGVQASYFSRRRFLWVFLFLLILAFVNLLQQRQRVWPIYWIVSLAIVLYTLNIDAWWFAVIGDEYSFYRYAREIAQEQSLSFIGSHLFEGQAVYGAHPYLSSVIQAISMRFFGVHNFGWRFSSLYLSALSIGFLYAFFKAFVHERIALITVLFLASSHYIMSFGKIGYNNLQALFAMALALWATAWAIQSRRFLAFVMLGLAAGFCFYVYPAALYVLPIVGLLLLRYDPPIEKLVIRRWAVMAMTLIFLIAPLFLQPGYWKSKIAGTLFYNPRIAESTGRTIFHFASNLLYSLFSFLFIPDETHFVAASYVDPLTAVFVLIGIVYLLGLIGKRRFVTTFMAGFLTLLFLAGASHDRMFPSATRMFMLLPWFAFFAAIGLTYLMDQLGTLGASRQIVTSLIVLIVIAVVGLNLYQAYPLSKRRMAGRYQQLQVLFLRLSENILTVQHQQPKKFIFINDPSTLHIDSLRELLHIYSVPFGPSQIVEVVPQGPELPAPAISDVVDPNSLIIINPRMQDSWKTSYHQKLRELGKVSCEIRNTKGELRFLLWHARGSPKICRLAQEA